MLTMIDNARCLADPRSQELHRASGKRVNSATSTGYDWCTLSQTVSAGNRQEDVGEAEPLAWPEYKKWYTKEAPSWCRFQAERNYSVFCVYVLCRQMIPPNPLAAIYNYIIYIIDLYNIFL